MLPLPYYEARVIELSQENHDLRAKLDAANTRPVALWTGILLVALTAFFAGAAWFAPIRCLHTELRTDNAPVVSETDATVLAR